MYRKCGVRNTDSALFIVGRCQIFRDMRHQVIFLSIIVTIFLGCQGDRMPSIAYNHSNQVWGFMNISGKTQIPPNFQEVRDFHDGRAAFRQNNKWGYIDHQGKKVIKPKYAQAHSFSNHIARVVTPKGKTKFIKPNGKLAFHLDCDNAGNFHNNLAPFWKNNKVGYVNTSGKIIIHPTFLDGYEFQSNVAIIKTSSGYSIINNSGALLLPAKYKNIYKSPLEPNTIYTLKSSSGTQYYNLKTQKFIGKKYTDGKAFFHESAVVKVNDKYGVINTAGDWILQPIYPNLTNLGQSRWAVKYDGDYYMIDSLDRQLGGDFKQLYRFSEGLATAQIDQKWGYVDTSGEFIIPPIYKATWPFYDAKARVVTNDGVGFLNQDGEIIIQPIIPDIRNFHEDLARYCIKK